MSLEKVYQPSLVEDRIYQLWEASGYFNPDHLPTQSQETFVISMPPPNATGVLHVGHASMLAYQDVLIRFHRMLGKKTLWLPGTDHAAIATQTKVEKLLLEQEGKTRHDLGREAFLKRVHDFVEDSRATIKNQVKKMGSSCDWSRERYTLEEGLTDAVYEIFIRMYEDGLIYRGNRIVHWCPRCASTLADDEVEYKKEKTKFYYFKYGPVIIGTARPETKFLDKVIVVHPDDERYKDIIGKTFTLEWIQGPINATVIADKDAADMNLGTGAMTITPAHSFVDFELAQKHQLEIVQIIDEKGNFTDMVDEPFKGKNAFKNREEIVRILQEKGLVHEIDENYEHNLSICYRCQTTVEPLISKQWFVDVNKEIPGRGKSLKEVTAEPVRNGDITILPERFNKVYFQWINHLRDWCISRQIWFGHRIPVYYCQDCHEVMVSKTSVTKCATCESANVKQDEDTLDTWFSSGLWTFSTLGWPKQTKDLDMYHPTSVMETGYDIIFFWVARMILMSQYALNEKPFQTVYLHGLVRDKQNRKMSKSLGNILDPLEVIAKFGTDALRLSLISGTSPGADVKIYDEKIESFRNFVNKLWNISRYVLISVKEIREVTQVHTKTLADTWILQELNDVSKQVSDHLEQFRFSQAIDVLHSFTWDIFADWYIEIVKIEGEKDDILLYILDRILRLWHPFIPFITESIYQEMYQGKKVLMIQSWPSFSQEVKEKTVKMAMEDIMHMIKEIRRIRNEFNIPPKQLITGVFVLDTQETDIPEQIPIIEKLARLQDIRLMQRYEKEQNDIQLAFPRSTVYLSLGDIDTGKIKEDFEKELRVLTQHVNKLEAQLQNTEFTSNAPKHIIEERQESVRQSRQRISQLTSIIDQI